MIWQPPPLNDDLEIRDHQPLEGWRDAMLDIQARHALGTASPIPVESGSDAVWCIGDVVVKLTTPTWRHQINREAAALRFVRGKLPVAMPEVVATGDLQGWPYIVMSKLNALPVADVWHTLNHSARLRLAAELGDLVQALHKLAPPNWGDEWTEFWAQCTTEVAARHHEEENPPHLEETIHPYINACGELDSGHRVLLHTELLDQHIYVKVENGLARLAGLIDFADSRVGPPEYDFAAPAEFIFKGEQGLLRAFLEGYGESPASLSQQHSRRMLAWALCHRYGRLSRSLRAIGDPRPADLNELADRLYGLAVR